MTLHRKMILFVMSLLVLSTLSIGFAEATSPIKYTFENVLVEVTDIFTADNHTLYGEHEYFKLKIYGNYKDKDERLKSSSEIVGFDNMGNIPDNVRVGDLAIVELQKNSFYQEGDAWAINSMKLNVNKFLCCGYLSFTFLLIIFCSVVLVIGMRKKRNKKKMDTNI